MRRSILFSLFLLLLFQVYSPGEEPAKKPLEKKEAQKWTKRVEELPEKWPGGMYDVYENGELKKRETVTFEDKKARVEGKPAVEIAITTSEDDRTREILCRTDRWMTPERIVVQDARKLVKYWIFEEGKAVDRSFELDPKRTIPPLAGRGDEIEFPEGKKFTSVRTIDALATTVPFETGKSWEYSIFTESKIRPFERTFLRCVGREKIKIADREWNAWKITWSGREGDVMRTYWVTEERFLLKRESGETEWVLHSAEKVPSE